MTQALDAVAKSSFKYKRKTSPFYQWFRNKSQCSDYASREIFVFGEVKFYYITLVVSNIMLISKRFFFIFLGNNNNLIMNSLEKKEPRQIIYDQIRTDKICNTYWSMLLCLRILHDPIRSDTNHSSAVVRFLF